MERFNQIYRARKDIPVKIPISEFLDRILVLPAVDIYDLFMQLSRFEYLLKEMNLTTLIPKLIIIDNVAAPFKLLARISYDRRTKVIDKLARDLRALSVRYNCAVVTVNQLTRKMVLNSDPESSITESMPQYQFIPMLGQAWRNHVDSSIFLGGDHEKGR